MRDFSSARFPAALTLLIYLVAVTVGIFVGGLWASLGLGCAVLLFIGVSIGDRHIMKPQRDVLLLAFASLVVIALLNLQSTQPHLSWKILWKLTTIFLPLCVLTSRDLAARAWSLRLMHVLIPAALIGAISFGIELKLGGPLLHVVSGPNSPLTDYNRGISYSVILALPLMAGLMTAPSDLTLKQRWAILALFVIALMIPAGLTESRAAKLALVLGLATAFAGYVLPIVTQRILMLLPFLFIGWPFAARYVFVNHFDWLGHLPDSWRARMEIWDYMSYRIGEKPWLGWGLGSAHTLDFMEPHGVLYRFTVIPAAHPHNVITQLWVELGLPGLALGIFFALLMLCKAARLEKPLVPFALGAWAACFCLCLVAYNFWTDSIFAAMALTGFLFAMLNTQLKQVRHVSMDV
jgi:O-antigen ligase